MNKFMQMAIEEARKGIQNGDGGPFGAVIVKDGVVIRNACANLSSFDLSGADIYTTGEPCPMCLGAILWSNINQIYYGCTIQENDMIGFRDEVFYKNLSISTDKMKDKIKQLDHDECLKLFHEYLNIKDRTMY